MANGLKKGTFINQKNLWKYLERRIFEKASFEKLTTLRSQKPTPRIITRKKRGSSKKKDIFQENRLSSKKNDISQENRKKNEISEEKRLSSKKNDISKENRKKNEISEENRLSSKKNDISKENRKKTEISEENSKKISKEAPISSLICSTRTRLRKKLSKSISRSRSRSLSQLSQRISQKKPQKPQNSKFPLKNTQNPQKIVEKPLMITTLTINDLLSQQKNIEKPLEKAISEEEPDSPHVSEKEIELRRQINEVRIRKIIAKIDAPGYSIDRNITYYKDIENKAEREDVFESLMGDLFQHPEENEENKEEMVEKSQILKENEFIVVSEEEGEKTKNAEKNRNENIVKSPAFEFLKKEGESKENWLEKRWVLSRRPFSSRHIINSVFLKCLENVHNEKDVKNIGRHFIGLKFA